MSESLVFEVQLRSITHLGRKLYDNLAAAIAELIANSWDAYATRVDITIDEDRIIFSDNGIGMNYDELSKRYCPIGKEKILENIRVPKELQIRPPMGKKGIGKLAAFSIGDYYDVITKVNYENNARKFTLEYDTMKNFEGPFVIEVENIDECQYFENKDSSGFIVEVYGLRKKITSTTIEALKRRVSRRFAMVSTMHDFAVSINGELIAFDESYLNDKIQYLWIYSNNETQKKEIEDAFKLHDESYTKKPTEVNYIENAKICDGCIFENQNEQCTQLEIKNKDVDVSNEGHAVYGWIGTFDKSGDSKSIEGDNLNILQILFNQKIADEDLLTKIGGKEVAKSYIHGRIHADFIDKLDDPITSSRQGLDESVPEITQLICYMSKHVKKIINFWNEKRSKNQQESIFKRYPDIKKWYDSQIIEDDSKRVIDKFFNAIGKIEFTSDSVEKTILKNTVIAFEDAKYMNKLFQLDELLEEGARIENIVMQFNDLGKLEANRYRQILQNRFNVVEKLDKAVEDNEKEKILHKLIEEHLWLVDPHWDSERDISRSERKLKDEFKETDDKVKLSRFDILLRKPHESKYPILIELKRPDAKSYTPSYYEAMGQVAKYRSSAAKYYKQYEELDIRPDDIHVIFIWEKNDNFDDLDEVQLSSKMKNDNFTILRYSKIIKNVTAQYKEFLDEEKSIAQDLGFLMKEEWK